MIDEGLLSKFDRIQDLPVPEEMLGAYIEGGLNIVETLQLKQYFIDYPALDEFIKELSIDTINRLEPTGVSVESESFLDSNLDKIIEDHNVKINEQTYLINKKRYL